VPGHQRKSRLLVQIALLVLGNASVFTILSIWAPARVLMLALALLAFGGGVALGMLGVVVSPLVVGVIIIRAELVSRHPLSTHRFLVSGSLGFGLIVLLGLAGYSVRVGLRRLDANRRKANTQAAFKVR
jgi:hypothetical protein